MQEGLFSYIRLWRVICIFGRDIDLRLVICLRALGGEYNITLTKAKYHCERSEQYHAERSEAFHFRPLIHKYPKGETRLIFAVSIAKYPQKWYNENDKSEFERREKEKFHTSGNIKKDDWIIEGVYFRWVGDCFHDADCIYLLEIPKRVYTYRIIRRFIRRKLGIESGKKETIKSVTNLIRWTDTWQKQNLPEINAVLSTYKNKMIRLRNNREINRIIN